LRALLTLHARDNIACLDKITIAHCKSREETERGIAVVVLAGVTSTGGGGGAPAMSGGEGVVLSGGEYGNSANEGASDNENSWTYYFRDFTVTLGHVKEMTIPELNEDEAVIFEHFFADGLCMPLHPALEDILWKFQMQLHKLTPNGIAESASRPPSGFWCLNDKTIKELMTFAKCETGKMSYKLH
jgi:hypothetical protein